MSTSLNNCKRALCGADTADEQFVIFELEAGGCVLSRIDYDCECALMLFPAEARRHMPYTEFVPASGLPGALVDAAREKAEIELSGREGDLKDLQDRITETFGGYEKWLSALPRFM